MVIWAFDHYAEGPDGMMTRMYDLSKRLIGRGHRVTIFASGFSHYKRCHLHVPPGRMWSRQTCDGVDFVHVKTFPYSRNNWRRMVNMLTYAWRVLRVAPRVQPRPDVIIASCPHNFALLSAYLLARRYKVAFCCEIRDLWPQTLVDMKALSERHPLTRLLRAIEKHMLLKSERIVTVIQGVDRYTAQLGVPTAKVVWIPNGVDFSRSTGGLSTQQNRIFTVMYCGAHATNNGLDTIVRAAAILQRYGRKDIRFVFVGDGARKPALIALANALGLSNVEFRPPVARSAIAAVMAEASAFVIHVQNIPVLRYGVSPNKLYDYMAAAKPVIYAVASSNNPVADCNAGLTAASDDPQAIADAVVHLAAMTPEQRAQMGANGLRYVTANHNLDTLAAKLEASLYEVCGIAA